MKKHLFLTFFTLLFIVGSYAQVTTSNIRGQVSDDMDQPLFGANIVAVHTPTGTKYGAITNEDGRFNLLNLRVGGPYEITISYIGFQTKTQNDVYLTLGQTFNIDAKLLSESQALMKLSWYWIGPAHSAVTVQGPRPALVEGMTRLPTISRSTNDFYKIGTKPLVAVLLVGVTISIITFSLDGAIFNNPFGLDAAQPGGQSNALPFQLRPLTRYK